MGGLAVTVKRALEAVREAEASGKLVRRVVIDGKRLEIEFLTDDPGTEFELVDMERKK